MLTRIPVPVLLAGSFLATFVISAGLTAAHLGWVAHKHWQRERFSPLVPGGKPFVGRADPWGF